MNEPRKKSAYFELLKDPRWQKKRLEIMQRDEFTCQICANTEASLNVHHKWYDKGKSPWEYPDDCLITLCEQCHNDEREYMAESIDTLVRTMKRHFLSGDIHDIAVGFDSLKMVHMPEVVASIIHYALETENVQLLLRRLYFNHLKDRKKADDDLATMVDSMPDYYKQEDK